MTQALSEYEQYYCHLWPIFFRDQDVIELRAPQTEKMGTVSGYFNNPIDMAREVQQLNGKGNIYITLNPVNPELLARAVNRAKSWAKQTTGDSDIITRRWLMVDFDPRRPSGISSNDVEHAAALDRATQCRDWLDTTFGIKTILADSGNGGHVLVPVELPNDTQSATLCQSVLAGLSVQFGDALVDVDHKTYNSARICKLYGTIACKGDSTADRPHRVAYLIHVPEQLTATPVKTLEQIAALAPTTTTPATPKSRSNVAAQTHKADFTGDTAYVRDFIARHALKVAREGEWNNGYRWVLEVCPFNPAHTDKSAAILQLADGAKSFTCHHDGCRDNNWRALRTLLEGGRQTDCTEDEDEIHESDLGNARRLIQRYGRTLRYVSEQKTWLVWTGLKWEIDTVSSVKRQAHETIGNIIIEAAATSGDRRQRLIRHALHSESAKSIEAMVNVAKDLPGVAINAAELDRQPWLLSVKNGILDLRLGQLVEPIPEHLMTLSTSVEFDATATCPHWLRFLERVVPNEQTRDFLKRYAGYSLTGVIREQVMAFLYGNGRNGKSTFIGVLEALLGGYWVKTRSDVLMASRFGPHKGATPELIELKGKRLVTVSEIQSDHRLDEALIKDLTGGDAITARALYSKPITFEPTHKLWMYGNYKPEIRGTDTGIWRRPRLIPFTQTISAEECDSGLLEKLLAELPGILNWALEGCLAWQQHGLGEPPEVREATEEYRTEMDVIGEFILERCQTAPSMTIGSTELYTSYKTFCNDLNEVPKSHKVFSQEIEKRSFKIGRIPGSGRKCFYGISTVGFGMNRAKS